MPTMQKGESMITKYAAMKIDTIANGKWLNKGSREKFVILFRKLISYGLQEDEAIELLRETFWAAVNEFRVQES